MSLNYFYNSALGRYVQNSNSYTGPSTKSTGRYLEPHELENIKIRQLERIANALEIIVEQNNLNVKHTQEQEV